MKKSLGYAAGLLFVASNAYALPIHRALPSAKTVTQWSEIDVSTATYDFEGIVALDNCSGSLVRFENSAQTDKALVLTNGHCVKAPGGGFIRPGQFLSNKTENRSFGILSVDGKSNVGTVRSSKILYATMTGTDLALYELTSTYAEIAEKFKTHPLTILSKHSELNDSIEILSGYWRRGYSCKVEAFVYQLKEDEYTWTDSIRYEQGGGCNTIHGTSGSPILAAGTKNVVGINNTGSDNGERCTMDNPCEVDKDGKIFYKKGINYGQQTHIITTCLTKENKLDLSVPGCALFH